MTKVLEQIHVTPARKAIFDKIVQQGGPFLFRDLYQDILRNIRHDFQQESNESCHILLKEPLSEVQEARLREIWEATMPLAPIADRTRGEIGEKKE